MRFDLVSIFPQYFDSLSLSLLGRADRSGLVSVRAHDLRDWAHGAHRSVDDAPYGGGAGMVMLPGVWCAALDEILGASCGPVLAVPTPSGTPLTQRLVGELARADHIVVACGRYEGIDQRVADHYRERGLRVLEYSIGDYVLNGGEAAAAVLVEAVARLVEGFMGNPDSLAEESHGDGGLLEYPAYTKPRSFRGLDVPDVLLSGDHGAIRRWRRDQSLLRTAQRRPDLIDALDPAGLDAQDREALASCGVVFAPGPTRVRYLPGERADAAELAAFAARTFPMAVPPQIPAEDVARFIREELDEASFRDHLAGPGTRVLIARALVRDPSLLILDEPLAGIDRASRQALADTLTSLHERGLTLITVLHEMGELADIVERAVVLVEGRISSDGPARDLSPSRHDHAQHDVVGHDRLGDCDHEHPHGSTAPSVHHAPTLTTDIPSPGAARPEERS